jgi:hypothetical protein
MDRINVWSKTNFFEKRNNDYRKAVGVSKSEWDAVEDSDEEW